HGRGDVEVVAGGREPGAAARGEALAAARVQRLEHAAERAEPGDERGRGLLAHAGHAGQAVAGVAAQHREVGVAAAGDAELRGDVGLVDHLEVTDPPYCVKDAAWPRVVDELEQVAVPGDHV